jgi:Zn-dependent peptidase ImmA (M78 family)
VPQVSPEVLRWARETAGFTLDEAALKLSINDAHGLAAADRLALFEAGGEVPPRPLLLKMSKQYRRPLLTFYMAAPPRPAPKGEDFRTLPEEFAARDVALVDALLREVRARQEMVRALLEAEDEASQLAFVGSARVADGAENVANAIAKTLGFDLQQFRRGNARTGRGFTYLRRRAEAAGVFVLLIGNLGSYHSALDVELFRGFAVADRIAPFIVINDQDSEQAWSFTLLHELAHLWLGQTGVSGAKPGTTVEVFCNDVAGRILLPAADVANEQALVGASRAAVVSRIDQIAEANQVSHSMVAYKLFRQGVITTDMWANVTTFYRQQWVRSRAAERDARDDESGPNYYTVKKHRLGDRLLALSRRMLAEGALSPTKAAAILGVRPNVVYPLMAA